MGVLTCDKSVVSLSDTQSSFTKILILICTTAFGFVLVLSCTEGHEATEELQQCFHVFCTSETVITDQCMFPVRTSETVCNICVYTSVKPGEPLLKEISVCSG